MRTEKKKRITALSAEVINQLVIPQSGDGSDWDKPVRAKLRPLRGNSPFRTNHVIWVSRTGVPLSASTVTATLPEIRGGRDRQNGVAEAGK